MRASSQTTRAGRAALAGAVLAVVALSGCGVARGDASSNAHAASPAISGAVAATLTTAAPGVTRPTGTKPPSGLVPGGFAAASVTFVSPRQAFVLGTAPCKRTTCTAIAHTTNRGATWRGLPAPLAPVGWPGTTTGPMVWGIRFATPTHGFVFGDGLWETTDGGEHWARATYPASRILSLATIDNQVLALTATCYTGGCANAAALLRRALTGGPWHLVARITTTSTADPTDLISTQARVAAVLDGTSVVVTSDGGLTSARHPTPCAAPGVATAAAVGVTGQQGLALLCGGQGYTGHVNKTVYLSSDLGSHWTKAGAPPSAGDPYAIAAATPARLVVAAASAASWLYASPDHAIHWQTAYLADDGGQGWADLGFTTSADGVAVHGPVLSDGNREGRPGQLLLTSDGGMTWRQVRF